jgi:hypothetical protein
MSSEHPEQFSEPPANRGGQSDARRDSETAGARQTSDARRDSETAGAREPSDDASHHEATTVLVRGETIRGQEPKPSPNDRDNSPRKEVSEAKTKMQSRLPALDDDADVGVRKDHIVIRDGKADLAFAGTLLASAAPPSAPTGQWHEYRIYETSGGKHVFSKVTRSVYAEEPDTHAADVFDPSPSTVPSQLLRGARDLARSRPLTWMDAAVSFFGYDPLAKALYRKLSGQFEEHIS